MRGRAFSGDGTAVASRARAALGAYARGRVAATVKHFPGIGTAARNTDDAPVTLPASRAEVADRDLAPFRAAVAARAPLVMASHALYPAYDRRRIASQSRVLLTDVLRGRLGFRGAVVTDSLEATAVQARSSVETAALRSLSAGADLMLMTGPGSFPRVRRALLAEGRRSPVVRRRIRAAAANVLALKRGLGLPAPRS
jgi:beta-N-acetylhexosaminidase